MRRLFKGVLALVVAVLAAQAAVAQSDTPPALIADRIVYDATGDRLIASGNVEIIQANRVLRATEIIYSNSDGSITATGPLTLIEPGQATLLADLAELDQDLTQGVVYGARLLLAENFQFAAAEAQLIDEDRLGLAKVIASTCQVCAGAPTPLWLIRASKVVRDSETNLIHVEDAYFDAFGMTVAYLPYFRFPDPTVRRASGFLEPRFTSSNLNGFGIKLPYFIVINDHSDMTVTPYLTSSGAAILEGEYRRLHANGLTEVTGSVAVIDPGGKNELRGHMFAEGAFALNGGRELTFALNTTTDKTYLNNFGYSNTDRLTSEVTVSRQRESDWFSLSAVGFQTLRANEKSGTVPFMLPEWSSRSYRSLSFLPGRLTYTLDGVGLLRLEGRDVAQFGASADWHLRKVFGSGLVSQSTAGVEGLVTITQDDSSFSDRPVGLAVPYVAQEFRFPLISRTPQAEQTIEPVVQLIYSDVIGNDNDIPNEDSVLVEFDATNIFSLDRFPGNDRFETGFRLNIGANYRRVDANGWQLGLTGGQVLRTEKTNGFSDNTGLGELASNFVAAAVFEIPDRLLISNQALFDDKFEFFRNDIQLQTTLWDTEFDASYVFLEADPTAGANTDRHEISTAIQYRINDYWQFDADWRHDLFAKRNVTAGSGIEFENECVSARFSVSRRFADSNNLPDSTEFGLEIALTGLTGGSRADRPMRKTCTQIGPL